MKSAASTFCSGYWIAVSICLISSSQGRAQNYQDGRAVYLSHAPNKAGWRPIVTAGSVGMSGLVTYNLGNVAKQNNQPKNQLQATQKIMTGPANQETKQGIANSPRPHLKGFSSDFFGSAISTSTRPLVTRDLNNKLSTLGQNYKTSHFPLNSLNYNAPINSYMNPFSLGASNGINPYKLTQGYQFDNNAFIRHQQPLASHRPVYNNHQGQIMQGKRQKVNQLQAQILQQIAANQYHQSLQSYHNSLARPVESHPRPVEQNSNKNQGNNNNKGNINNQGSNNNQGNNNAGGNNKPVNPHESLSKLTKAHSQNVSPVTYKPPLGSQFQHFGVQEDSFGPIPSSILGSFSSFGHASVKARDPVIYNSGKTGYLATPTKSPYITNETYGSTSTVNTDVVVSPQSPSSSATSVQNFNSGNVKDDFSNNLVPPPQVQTHYENYQHKNYSAKNLTLDKINSFSSPSTQSNFFSSPSVQSNSFSNPSVQSNSFSNPSVQSNSFSNPSVQSNSFSNPSVQSNSFSNPSVQSNSFSNPSVQSNSFSNPSVQSASFSSPSASGGSFSSPAVQGNFIPSPLDPLSKYQGSLDSQRFPSIKLKQQQNYVYNTNLSTKRPGVSSFFDSTLSSVSTIDPFEPQSTNVVPENLLVQLPPPYNSFNPFNGQSIKLATNHKDKYQAFSQVNHNSPISNTKYQVNEDIQFFPPREQEYFGTKYNTNNYQTNPPKTPTPHKYEVTETWGPSGEAITQPTLHSWLNPSQSFQQYSIPSKALGSSKTPSKEISKHENKLLSQPYFPTSVPSSTTQEISSDVTTIYSTIAEKNQNNFLNQLENSLTPIKEIISDRKKPDLAAFSSPSPVYSSTAFNIQSETPPKVTSEIYDEVTTRPNVRRKPSRYRPQQETSTASSAEEDYTTRFETFKEHIPATENELQVVDLPTIPPSKFFKRPALTTPPANDNWNEEKTKKRNKLRRRRPSKPSTTTEEAQEETIATTDIPVRTYNRYKTTSPAPEVEDVTKPLRPRFRYNHKARPTRPTSQSESTSSAQPTTLPTSPVTTRPKLHSRIRGTTQSSLDFEDLSETTTIREPKVSATVEQSSIMKIAKDHHFHRSPSTKYSPTGIGIFNDSPDYSHKQDEKDTPTSDISVNTYESKYSSQKFREGSSVNTEEFQNIKTKNHDSAHHSSNLEVQVTPTLPSLLDENLGTTYVQASQSTRVVQFTDQKSGNRGSAKPEENLITKTETDEETVPPTAESEPITTTPASSSTKSNRLKTKSSKYDTNRPRFSVKDYRNRLNQYSSTSSTEKPVEVVSRNRFPNRSRFPSFKDPYGDSKSAGSEQSTSTEQPRKKFMPKDPRHKGGDENIIEEILENNVVPSIRVPPSQKANFTLENVAIAKAPRVRGSIRRDPARKRTTTSTETPFEVKEERTEKHTQKSNNVYTISKRPNLPTLRKRGQNATKTVEIMEMNPTEPIISIVPSTESVLFNLEDDNKAASTEKSTSETAIMKIAKEERKHPVEEAVDSMSVDPSQRVADLTLAASKEYNTSGLFKSVSPNTRRVPDYFTIATDDPILPIEAFFPQLNQKKDS